MELTRTTTVSVALLLFLMFSLKTLPSTANADEKTFTWTDSRFGVIVEINLVTELPWTTNNTCFITVSFTVQRLSGFANFTFYNNSRILLEDVELDPFAGVHMSPFENLTEGQIWTKTWNFTPRATDLELSERGIRKGKSVSLPLLLRVGFTVVDLEGNEWEQFFRSDEIAVTVIGGPDALGWTLDHSTFLVILSVTVVIIAIVTIVVLRYRRKQTSKISRNG